MDSTTKTTTHDVLIIGAGPAGLATAACLAPLGLEVKLIDRALEPASSWRHHYERLHLHTVKSHSALPGLPFPDSAPRYVPRESVVEYLMAYAEHHGLRPELGQEVVAIEPAPPGTVARWSATTAGGGQRLAARHVVLATGANRKPSAPELPGQADFGGRILHSRSYRNAAPFAGQRVLVVGMGNTGAEIALDLVEHGVR
ncbi:MAG: flavin-containing monooxygenase, partial [Hydrogenophaga sp.]